MKILTIAPRDTDPDRNVLTEILDELGEVTTLLVDPDAEGAGALPFDPASPFDLTLFWRTEAIAAQRLAFGPGRAVIVPSATPREGAYWQQFAGAAHFLTFSRRQHEWLEAHECRSACFDYWPEPPAAPPAFDLAPEAWTGVFVDDGEAGMPSRGSALQQCRLLGIAGLTVLDEPARGAGAPGDVPLPDPLPDSAPGGDAETRALFVFASPARGLAPGIDHATRAAMGRGQIVVAPDAAPASETIGHMASGILTDPLRPTDLPALDRDMVERLSHGARARATIGHRMWLEDRPRLVSVLKDDGARWAGSDPSAHLGNAIQKALHRRAGGA